MGYEKVLARMRPHNEYDPEYGSKQSDFKLLALAPGLERLEMLSRTPATLYASMSRCSFYKRSIFKTSVQRVEEISEIASQEPRCSVTLMESGHGSDLTSISSTTLVRKKMGLDQD